jgi:hypothetical protein
VISLALAFGGAALVAPAAHADSSSPENRYDFSGGCNKSSTLAMQIAEGARIDYKVCVSIKALPDECSVWTTDRA